MADTKDLAGRLIDLACEKDPAQGVAALGIALSALIAGHGKKQGPRLLDVCLAALKRDTHFS